MSARQQTAGTAAESRLRDSPTRTHTRTLSDGSASLSGPGIGTDGPPADALTPSRATREAAAALGRAAVRDYARSIRSRRHTWTTAHTTHHEVHTEVWLRSYADPAVVAAALVPLGTASLVNDWQRGVHLVLVRSVT